MKAIIIFLIITLHISVVSAQDIEVKKFEPLEKDLTATLSPRKDINGVTCGLVKVLLKEPGVEFEGSVMGDVQFTGKEYLVYLPNGTKRLGIKHPDYLPTTIVFADYGTKKIESGVTYQMKLNANKKPVKVDKSKKGMAVFNIKPSNAMLLIDGDVADGSSGGYTLQLPYGTHHYTVKLNNFMLTNLPFTVDKNAKTYNIDLSEYFASIVIHCATNDADVFIDDELKGIGNANETVVPGRHVIEIRKEGYHSFSKSIELNDNETCRLDIPQMTAIVGTLQVVNELPDCDVIIDGKSIGKTPLKKELPIGDYQLEVKHELYRSYKANITINEEQTLLVNEKLIQTQLGKIIQQANQGDRFAMNMLSELYLYGSKEVIKKNESWWIYDIDGVNQREYINHDIFIEEGIIIQKDIEKASVLVNKLIGEDEFYRSSLCDELMVCYLTGDGVTRDFDKSFFFLNHCRYTFWFEYIFAWHYYYGKGVKQNTEKALEHMNELRRYIDRQSMPYKSCNRDLFIRLLQPTIDNFDWAWDARLINFFKNNIY